MKTIQKKDEAELKKIKESQSLNKILSKKAEVLNKILSNTDLTPLETIRKK